VVAGTLDIHNHVEPGLQEAAANRFDEIVMGKGNKIEKETKEIIQ
jgi:hypothetical protein